MRPVLGVLLGILLGLATGMSAQIRVELDDVIDNRVEAGELRGMLEMRVKLTGSNADKASAARLVVKEAKDDKGNVLSSGSGGPPDFTPREYNNGTLNLTVSSPLRSARTVKVKGTVELFMPDRDPSSIVKIDNGLTKLDAPLSHKTLKAAKVELTPLSLAGYKKAREKHKLDDTKIAEIRAEGKKRGVPEKEVEMMIELAKALDEAKGEPSAGTILFSGTRDTFDRIFKIEVLGEDGEPLHITSRSTSTRGDDALMTLEPSSPAPASAALQLYLLTSKSKVTTPFELTVELP